MNDEKLNNEYFFTFGTNHRINGISLGYAYVLIIADTMKKAREIMVEHHSDKWAFAYHSAEEAGVEKFNLDLFAQYGEMS